MKSKIIILLSLLLLGSCKKDFLTRLPQDQLTDETYWTSEDNVRVYAYGFYPVFFRGYDSGFDLRWGGYFSGQSLNDDFAPSSPTPFISVVPPTAPNPALYTSTVPYTGGGWTYIYVRKANLFINRVQAVPMSDEAKNNWTAVGRFFRALQYAKLVNAYGDVPWYDEVEEENSPELYKPRDPRTTVMDHVLEDFQFAIANLRESDPATGNNGSILNRDVALAFMSRVFLFEGTYLKYHNINASKAEEYLTQAKFAANELIQGGKYTVNTDYRNLFSSESLAGNPEIILYRQYGTSQITHSLMSYVNKEAQSGVSKDFIEAYLASDGLPISISPLYQGDQSIEDVMANRDPRITETIVDTIRVNGAFPNYSTSGYATLKFLNEALKEAPAGLSSNNITDAPVIRFGEVLMNYAEATAELGTLTQNDLDISINALRQRPGINMPNLQVIGGNSAVNGVVYDDPERDPTVSSLLWEIRRERRIELAMEGFRLDDLRRWAKLEYTDNPSRPDINRGAWINVADYPTIANVTIENNASEGYIIPAASQSYRLFNNPRVYLDPIPLDQIKLYQDNGVELVQNPGWQ